MRRSAATMHQVGDTFRSFLRHCSELPSQIIRRRSDLFDGGPEEVRAHSKSLAPIAQLVRISHVDASAIDSGVFFTAGHRRSSHSPSPAPISSGWSRQTAGFLACKPKRSQAPGLFQFRILLPAIVGHRNPALDRQPRTALVSCSTSSVIAQSARARVTTRPYSSTAVAGHRSGRQLKIGQIPGTDRPLRGARVIAISRQPVH